MRKKSGQILAMTLAALLLQGQVLASETLVGVSSETTAMKQETAKTQDAGESEKEKTAETGTETETETETEVVIPNGWKVAIDPGHQGNWVDMSAPEPSAPGSSETKAKATTGTEGRYSGLYEFELNLGVSKVLKEELLSRGYEVVMTREDNDKAISNKERALLAAEENADILVRIHANGSDDPSVNGALTMVPSRENPYVGYMFEDCYELGEMILTAYCEAAGFANLGVGYYDNMSGINWSTIPVTILEMGFMSNESDDLRMADESLWPVMAEGIADGIDRYFEKRTPEIVKDGIGEKNAETEKGTSVKETDETSQAKETKKEKKEKKKQQKLEKAQKIMNALHDELFESMAVKASYGENWSAAAVDLTTGATCTVNDGMMQAASLIKLFIAGAIYERYDDICAVYGQGNVDSNLYSMITVSDNTAANTLTNYLGNGDDAQGRAAVTAYCERNGYENTVMGRMLLAPKDNGDNITSVSDCSEFLTKAYNKEIPHADDILNLLKHQERRHKIPAGLPEGVASGNKTGELADVENDAAIIFADRPYVLCIMSEYLQDVYDAEVDISNISTEVYQFISAQLK